MIAQQKLASTWRPLDEMTLNELVYLIISRDALAPPGEIENRLNYSDPVTLKRLAFLAQLQLAQVDVECISN
jgi:hypothetical protein